MTVRMFGNNGLRPPSNRAAAFRSEMSAGSTLHALSCSSFFLFLEYLSAVPPITIELPERASQTKFNLERWAEILADPALAKLPNRIETDRHGHILMSPPPAFRHSRRQGHIIHLLNELLPDRRALPEC